MGITLYVTLSACFLFVTCSTLENQTNYKQIFKENLRNCMQDDLCVDLIGKCEQFLSGGKVMVEVSDTLAVEVKKHGNNTVSVSLQIRDEQERQMKRKTGIMGNRFLPYLIIPGFVLAGLMPWVLPPLQLIVTIVAMANQMAFTSAVVALIRSYIFDYRPEEHIVYLNHGYKHKKKHRK